MEIMKTPAVISYLDIDIEAHISYTTGWYSKLPNFQFIHCFYSGLYKFADLTNQIQYKVFLD